MHETELLILGLCVAIPTLSVIARLLGVPYPIVLVVGAIPLGYLPGVPDVELDPDLVLVIFLPPLLYVAAFFADLRALRDQARALSLTVDRTGAAHDLCRRASSGTSSSACRGRSHSRSARSSRRPTRWPRPRSRASSAPPVGWST